MGIKRTVEDACPYNVRRMKWTIMCLIHLIRPSCVTCCAISLPHCLPSLDFVKWLEKVKIKVCTTEVMHTEKRKPRLLSHKLIGAEIFILNDGGVCIFAKTHTSLSMPKKGYSIPLTQKYPCYQLFSLCDGCIITYYYNFVNKKASLYTRRLFLYSIKS